MHLNNKHTCMQAYNKNIEKFIKIYILYELKYSNSLNKQIKNNAQPTIITIYLTITILVIITQQH